MQIINKKKLIKDGKYIGEFVGYLIFTILGIGIFLIAIIDSDGMLNKLISVIIVGGLVLIPFGYVMGLKRLLKLIFEVIKIIKGNFYITEKQIFDIQFFNNSEREVLLVFGENAENNLWLSHGEGKKYAVDDICYQFYLEGMHSNHGKNKPFAIYNKNKYLIAEELLYTLK